MNSYVPSKNMFLKSSVALMLIASNLTSATFTVDMNTNGSNPAVAEHRQSRKSAGFSGHGASYVRSVTFGFPKQASLDVMVLSRDVHRPLRDPDILRFVMMILTRSPG
jgi:hypothetical protein